MMCLVVEAFDGRVLDYSVHSFNLAVGPGMLGLGGPVIDVVPGAGISPARWRRLADARHYLPANIPAVKRVAAAAGDQLCARGRTIRVDGRPIAHRLAVDGAGRPVPLWAGCTMLGRDELSLIMDVR